MNHGNDSLLFFLFNTPFDIYGENKNYIILCLEKCDK